MEGKMSLFAYFDPNLGSLVFQCTIAFVVGSLWILKMYRFKFLSCIKSIFRETPDPDVSAVPLSDYSYDMRRFANFIAVRFSEKMQGKETLPDDLTIVNVFPRVFTGLPENFGP